MQDKTKKEYLSLALHHYEIMGAIPTYSNVKKYLESIALTVSPDYFRRIRSAFVTEQEAIGYTQNAKDIKQDYSQIGLCVNYSITMVGCLIPFMNRHPTPLHH